MSILAKKIDDNKWIPSITKMDGRYYINVESGETVVFSKLEKNKSFSKIKVNGTKHYYVISGDLLINGKEYEKGTYIRIDSDEEYIPKSKNGCIVLCIYPHGYSRLD